MVNFTLAWKKGNMSRPRLYGQDFWVLASFSFYFLWTETSVKTQKKELGQHPTSLRKFKLCICKKNIFFGAAEVKLKKDMILAGKLQFYQLQKRKTKKNSGPDGVWTQASQNIITNWATEVNVNSSALMPIYFYRTLNSPLVFASVTFWSFSVLQFFFLSAYILLSKRRFILLRDFSIWICDEISFFWLAD